MDNIWFLRMDKDDLEGYDLCPSSPYIHSVHGICGDRELTLKQKEIIFPKLKLSNRELIEHIYDLKQQLVNDGQLDEKAPGKQRCDLAIRYWLKTMQVGDAVFVRNKVNQLFLCKIASYVREEFFDKHGCFQRKVSDLKLLDESHTPKEILDRTYGRKTIEKNVCASVEAAFDAHFGITA